MSTEAPAGTAGTGDTAETLRTHWIRIRSEVRRRWHGLAEHDIDEIDGRLEVLTRKLRERCGIPESHALRQVEVWLEAIDRRPVTRA